MRRTNQKDETTFDGILQYSTRIEKIRGRKHQYDWMMDYDNNGFTKIVTD
jgi:hypothetical protein